MILFGCRQADFIHPAGRDGGNMVDTVAPIPPQQKKYSNKVYNSNLKKKVKIDWLSVSLSGVTGVTPCTPSVQRLCYSLAE